MCITEARGAIASCQNRLPMTERTATPVRVLVAGALFMSLLFAYNLVQNAIRQPYADMYAHVAAYLELHYTGHWLRYLWSPHVQHHQVWLRLLTWFDARAFG